MTNHKMNQSICIHLKFNLKLNENRTRSYLEKIMDGLGKKR